MLPIPPFAAKYLALALAFALVAGWAMIERSGRLGCEIERVQLVDQVAVLAARIKEQNQAVEDLAKTGRQQRAAGARALEAERGKAQARAGEIAALEAILAAKDPAAVPIPPQPPGAPAIVAGSCGHAIALVREDLTRALVKPPAPAAPR